MYQQRDHLAIYRPGTGAFWVLSNDRGVFTQVYKSTDGVGGFSLRNNADIGLAYVGSDLIFYTPGESTISIISKSGAGFTPRFQEMAPEPKGLGGMLGSKDDRILPLEYFSNGKASSLFLYRIGNGANLIVGPATAIDEGNDNTPTTSAPIAGETRAAVTTRESVSDTTTASVIGETKSADDTPSGLTDTRNGSNPQTGGESSNSPTSRPPGNAGLTLLVPVPWILSLSIAIFIWVGMS